MVTLLTRRPPKTWSTMLTSWEETEGGLSLRLRSKQHFSSLSRNDWRNSWASSWWFIWKSDEKSVVGLRIKTIHMNRSEKNKAMKTKQNRTESKILKVRRIQLRLSRNRSIIMSHPEDLRACSIWYRRVRRTQKLSLPPEKNENEQIKTPTKIRTYNTIKPPTKIRT